jgi:hypothetical protein
MTENKARERERERFGERNMVEREREPRGSFEKMAGGLILTIGLNQQHLRIS